MFKEAVGLRLAFSAPEQQQVIEHTFQTAGFPGLLRAGGEQFKKDGSYIEAARCFAQIGEKDEALNLLETCYQRRCTSFVTLKAEPDFEVLAQEQRFRNLLGKLGLPQ